MSQKLPCKKSPKLGHTRWFVPFSFSIFPASLRPAESSFRSENFQQASTLTRKNLPFVPAPESLKFTRPSVRRVLGYLPQEFGVYPKVSSNPETLP
jgi:hypothetical protein